MSSTYWLKSIAAALEGGIAGYEKGMDLQNKRLVALAALERNHGLGRRSSGSRGSGAGDDKAYSQTVYEPQEVANPAYHLNNRLSLDNEVLSRTGKAFDEFQVPEMPKDTTLGNTNISAFMQNGLTSPTRNALNAPISERLSQATPQATNPFNGGRNLMRKMAEIGANQVANQHMGPFKEGSAHDKLRADILNQVTSTDNIAKRFEALKPKAQAGGLGSMIGRTEDKRNLSGDNAALTAKDAAVAQQMETGMKRMRGIFTLKPPEAPSPTMKVDRKREQWFDKDGKPITHTLSEGQELIDAQGNVIHKNQKTPTDKLDQQTITVPRGSTVVTKDGTVVYQDNRAPGSKEADPTIKLPRGGVLLSREGRELYRDDRTDKDASEGGKIQRWTLGPGQALTDADGSVKLYIPPTPKEGEKAKAARYKLGPDDLLVNENGKPIALGKGKKGDTAYVNVTPGQKIVRKNPDGSVTEVYAYPKDADPANAKDFLVSLAPGQQVYDTRTNELLFHNPKSDAPKSEKDELMTVPPDHSVFDPRSQKGVYTAPSKAKNEPRPNVTKTHKDGRQSRMPDLPGQVVDDRTDAEKAKQDSKGNDLISVPEGTDLVDPKNPRKPVYSNPKTPSPKEPKTTKIQRPDGSEAIVVETPGLETKPPDDKTHKARRERADRRAKEILPDIPITGSSARMKGIQAEKQGVRQRDQRTVADGLEWQEKSMPNARPPAQPPTFPDGKGGVYRPPQKPTPLLPQGMRQPKPTQKPVATQNRGGQYPLPPSVPGVPMPPPLPTAVGPSTAPVAATGRQGVAVVPSQTPGPAAKATPRPRATVWTPSQIQVARDAISKSNTLDPQGKEALMRVINDFNSLPASDQGRVKELIRRYGGSTKGSTR